MTLFINFALKGLLIVETRSTVLFFQVVIVMVNCSSINEVYEAVDDHFYDQDEVT